MLFSLSKICFVSLAQQDLDKFLKMRQGLVSLLKDSPAFIRMVFQSNAARSSQAVKAYE